MKYQVTTFAFLSWHASAFTLPASRISSQHVTALFDSTADLGTKLKGSTDDNCDVLVLGSGPAARSIATLLSKDLDVLLADSNYDRPWPPNYGVWEDEWQAICSTYKDSFNHYLPENCINRKWKLTDCYFGGSFDIPTEQRFRIDRPYYRVDKNALQDALSQEGDYRVVRANHISEAINVNLYSPTNSLVHDETGSTIKLQTKDKNDLSVRTRLIVDCTGHETKLVLKDAKTKSLPPGFQIAYGVLVTVDETDVTDTNQIGPYDKDAMTLFDYRTDHFKDESSLQKAVNAPTFMYAMPLENNQIFFEETSLVGRPAVSFQECKDRCFTRLEHLGIKVLDIEEEEFCYIPMGGPLPAKDQRVIAFGGASAIVHPSTGYNLCRNMMASGDVAKAITEGLKDESVNLDKVSGAAYHAMWSPSNIRQRNFAVFGGEFLMKQKVEGLRGFFDGFFRLPLESWSGFLAGWPGLPNNEKHETWFARLLFGIPFLSKLPPSVAFDFISSIVAYTISEGIALPQSVTPLFGEPDSYLFIEKPKNQGDVAAKNEARKMMAESKLEMDIPVPFEVETTKVKEVAKL
eukprot:scaffold197_cov268-Chaetoceros_neogracile.AAC.70